MAVTATGSLCPVPSARRVRSAPGVRPAHPVRSAHRVPSGSVTPCALRAVTADGR